MASQTGSIDLTASNSVKLAAEAGWQSDLDSYYTKSEIDVTVQGINSTVSTKVGEDEVISSINQSSESVSINASKINLTGAVTISDLASDASGALTNAAKTATDYVTDINNNGITVHPKRSDYATSGGRAVINANGLTVYLGSDDVASYGASARIGKSNSDRVIVDSTNGITIYKSNSKRLQTTENGIDVYGSDGTTSVASFGEQARLGAGDSLHVIVGNDWDGQQAFSVSDFDGNEFVSLDVIDLTLPNGRKTPVMALEAVGADESILELVREINSAGTGFANRYRIDGCLESLQIYTRDSNDDQINLVQVDKSKFETAGRIEANYQAEVIGTQSSIALRANTAGNRGLYDVTSDEWMLYRPNNTSDIVINGDNFSVDASGLVNAGRKVIATGNAEVALAASAASGSTNRGLWDETGGAWIIYRSTGGSIVLGNSVSDVLYHRESTCTVNTTNATIYNNYNFCWNNGACCTVQLCVNLKSNLANGSMVDVATAPAGYRPPHVVFGSVMVTDQHINLQAEILGDGTIRVNNRSGSAVTTSANIYISFTFAL